MQITSSTMITAINLLGIWRWWIIRHIPRTRARNYSELAAFFFQILCLATHPMLAVQWKRETDVQKQNPQLSNDMVLLKSLTPALNRVSFALAVIYVFQMWSLKVAFLALFYDFKIHLTRYVRWAMYGTSVWIIITLIISFVYTMASCPLSHIGDGKCDPALTVVGVVLVSWGNISTDVALIVLGACIIRNLVIQSWAGRALWCMPVIGFIPLIATVVRFALAYKAIKDGISMEAVHEIYIYSHIEVTAGWIAFSLPALRVFMKRKETTSSRWTESDNSRQGYRKRSQRSEPFSVSIQHTFDIRSTHTTSETELNAISEPVLSDLKT